MTERIQALRKLIVADKAHHAYRREMTVDPSVYRKSELKDYQRMALRLKTFLENERPVILEGENIAFTRTLPDLPMQRGSRVTVMVEGRDEEAAVAAIQNYFVVHM